MHLNQYAVKLDNRMTKVNLSFAGPGLKVSLCRYFQNGYIQRLIRYLFPQLSIFLLEK
jgi:hypothetical protein